MKTSRLSSTNAPLQGEGCVRVGGCGPAWWREARPEGSRPGGGRRRAPARSVRNALVVVAMLLVAPALSPEGFPGAAMAPASVVHALLPGSALAAQTAESVARARYVRARDDFVALEGEAERLQPQWNRARAVVHRHREAGNPRAAADAFVNDFIPWASQYQGVALRAEAAKTALDEARRELIRALRTREDALYAELGRTPPRAREDEINRQIVRIGEELRELERERQPIAEAGFRPVPNLVAAPTDGPAELRAKAAFLEGIALESEGVMEILDQEVRDREQRLRLVRADRDSRDGILRFDGDRPPGTGAGTRATGQTVADRGGDTRAEAFDFHDLPLEEQIELLRSVRIQAEAARDEATARAADFRALAEARGRRGVPG